MITVREHRDSDRAFAASLMHETLARSPTVGHLPRSDTLLLRHITAIFAEPSAIIGIAEKDGVRVGAVLGQVTHHFGTDIPFVFDTSMGITPGDHAPATARALLGFLHKAARERGCHSVCMTDALGISGEALDRLAVALGYNAAGTTYRREL